MTDRVLLTTGDQAHRPKFGVEAVERIIITTGPIEAHPDVITSLSPADIRSVVGADPVRETTRPCARKFGACRGDLEMPTRLRFAIVGGHIILTGAVGEAAGPSANLPSAVHPFTEELATMVPAIIIEYRGGTCSVGKATGTK